MIKKAMIMAAGAGTRLNPLTLRVPKPMIPVVNTPILEFILKHLQSYGINDVIANTHYLADPIQDTFGGENKLNINFNYVHEPKLSGTAGGVKKTESFFEQGETFIVISGDALTDVNIEELAAKHKASGAMATMALKEVPLEEVKHFGVVVLDENNRIVEFQEKPEPKDAKSRLVNAGIYIFHTDIFKYIPADTFYDFAKDVFPEMMKNGEKLCGQVIDQYWNDIGTLKQYKESSFEVLNKEAGISMPYEESENGWLAPSCSIAASVTFEKKAIVGEGSSIKENVKLEGNNVIGNNCIIKQGAVIKDSIIWDNVIIEENACLEGCIIADNVIIKAGITVKKDAVIPHDTVVTSKEDYQNSKAKV